MEVVKSKGNRKSGNKVRRLQREVRVAVFFLLLLPLLASTVQAPHAVASNHVHFQDVPPLNGNGPAIHFAADYNPAWLSGYPCIPGSPTEPCVAPNNYAYFRPNVSATRGQLSKMLVRPKLTEGAVLQNPATNTFTDVPPSNTFYSEIETMVFYQWATGYPCGTNQFEPCDAQGRPYFRWGAPTTRGQFAKVLTRAMNQVRMYVAPSPPHFNDVPTTNTFYSYVETAYGHWAMRPASTGVFGVNTAVTRGDIAYGLFSLTAYERPFTHNQLYAGSNNWEHPYTPSCNSPGPAPGGYTSLPGNEAGFTQNYGVYSNYGVMAREIYFDSDAKYYLSCVQGYKVAIVFHAFDSPQGQGNCQNGDWDGDNFATNLPDPVRGRRKSACWWGDASEYRIVTFTPAGLNAGSPEYFAYHAWTPTDSQLEGEINVDNYQLNSNEDPVNGTRDNMQKFCYKRTASGQGPPVQPDVKYGIFRCP